MKPFSLSHSKEGAIISCAAPSCLGWAAASLITLAAEKGCPGQAGMLLPVSYSCSPKKIFFNAQVLCFLLQLPASVLPGCHSSALTYLPVSTRNDWGESQAGTRG